MNKDDVPTPGIAGGFWNLANQNPAIFILMMLMLGGQGVDVFSSQASNVEFRELRTDVENALQGITNNSSRITRLEERIDDLSGELRAIDRANSREQENSIRELRQQIEQLEEAGF